MGGLFEEDKPAAGSLADAIAIYELAKKHNVPCFSSSSLRFAPGIQELLKNEKLGTIAGAVTWGSCSYQEGTPDMFFYGIHGIEPLYALMGTGCDTVTRIQTKDTDLVSGVWKGGRVGTYRGIRTNKADFGAVAFGSKGIVHAGREGGYEKLCQEVGRFFKTKKVPVEPEETIEIFAFMEDAKLLDAKRGLATASGTTALLVSLHVLDVNAGDEVIVSPDTFVATYNAILINKALPVFADTDPATLTIDPVSIESRITERTRAILPVHIYGMPCDIIEAVRKIQTHSAALAKAAG